jgi:hypothetical protein
MRFVLALALSLGLAAAAPAQEIANDQAGLYPLRARLSPWPARPGKCHLRVEVGQPKEGPSALPTLKLGLLMDMPASKMRPLMARLPRLKVGHYEGDVILPMKGTWRIQFLLDTPTGEFRVVSLLQVGPGKPGDPLPAPDPGCGPEALTDPNLKVTCQPNPPRVGDNHLVIQIPPDQKVSKLMVGLDMAGMPMALAPQPAQFKGTGRYETDVKLPMNGVWQVRVDLDGRVPPPVLLNVNSAERRPVSQPLLWLSLAASLPLGLGFWLRKRPLAPLVTGLALAVSTFSAGAVIERYWPPLDAMDMSSAAPELNAPTPVLQATVQKVPLSLYKSYPAVVKPEHEQILTGDGVVWELLDADVAVKRGQSLGRVGDRILRAPNDGVVLRHLAEPGQNVNGPVLAFSPLDLVRVRADIPSQDRFLVRRGQTVDILDGDSNVRGVISQVSALSQGSHFWVEALVKNVVPATPAMGHSGSKLPLPRPGDDGGRPGTLPVGENVTMRCLVDLLGPTLCVPKEAVFESEGRSMVMVVSPVAGQQLAFRRAVTPGAASDTHREVLNGLQEGETVVALAQEPLPDGTLVTAASWGVGSYRDLMIPEDYAHSP